MAGWEAGREVFGKNWEVGSSVVEEAEEGVETGPGEVGGALG